MESNRQNQNRSSSTSLPTSPSWFTQIRSSVVPDDLPPDYDQLRITGTHRTSFQVDSETDYQHNQRRISSLNVNNLESSTSQKPVEDEIEPPPYESLFPEDENQRSLDDNANRREESCD